MNANEPAIVSYNQPREWFLWVLATMGGWLLGLLGNYASSIVLSMTGLGTTLETNPSQITPEIALFLMALSMGVLFIVGLAVG